MLQVSLKNY